MEKARITSLGIVLAVSLIITGCTQGDENREDQRIQPDEMYHENNGEDDEKANSK